MCVYESVYESGPAYCSAHCSALLLVHTGARVSLATCAPLDSAQNAQRVSLALSVHPRPQPHLWHYGAVLLAGFMCPDYQTVMPTRCPVDYTLNTNCYQQGLSAPAVCPNGTLCGVPYLPAIPVPPGCVFVCCLPCVRVVTDRVHGLAWCVCVCVYACCMCVQVLANLC